MQSSNSLSTKLAPSGAILLGVRIYNLGGDTIRRKDTFYKLTDEIHKAFSSTGYTGKSMKKGTDILMFTSIKNDTVYTGIGDKN